jgi:hypothetical protein
MTKTVHPRFIDIVNMPVIENINMFLDYSSYFVTLDMNPSEEDYDVLTQVFLQEY